MNHDHGDPGIDRTLVERDALATGHARLYRGRVIPVISGAEEPPAAEPPADDPPARPEWLPDKYENEQAFLSAHQAAERKITELGQSNSELREQMEELSSLVQQAPQQGPQDPQQNPFVLAYQRAVEDGDVPAQLAIQAQLMDTVVAQRLEAQSTGQEGRGLDPYLIGQMRDSIAARYQADEALQAKAFEIMETDPVVSRSLQAIADDPHATIGDLAPVVDHAYKLAQAGVLSVQNVSLAQQQAEQEKARERKIAAESLAASGPGRVASPDEQKEAWERIRNSDVGGIRIGQQ